MFQLYRVFQFASYRFILSQLALSHNASSIFYLIVVIEFHCLMIRKLSVIFISFVIHVVIIMF